LPYYAELDNVRGEATAPIARDTADTAPGSTSSNPLMEVSMKNTMFMNERKLF
jgi:hypothetical protein